ncbi:MAG: ATP-binding cassette domain-containing protein, partial [Myxococcales bacterium]|nr:ATP-binding cassette domain-containing protein [Myxococcales bacterium]
HEARADRNRQNILRRELEWLRRGPKARTTKQKARIDRAESLQSIAGPTEERSVEMHVQTTRAGGTVLETKKLTAGYEGAPPLVQDLTLVLTKGERVGIVGRNGAGKTTLLQTLLGKRPPLSGTVKIGKRTKTTYRDQSRQGLDPEKTVAENVAGDRTHVRLGDQDVAVRGYLGRFLFDYEQVRHPVGSLSGGEQTRTLLARDLREPGNLLVLDEPTNDLDTSTLAALEEQLVGMDATALIVTHDRTFLDRIATSILAFEEDGRVTKYAGNYSDYKERLRANAAEKSAKKTLSKESRKNSPKGSSAAPKKLTYGERLELEAIEPKIEAAEAAVAAIETELADPDLYKNNAADVPAKTAALESARTNLQSLMNRWEYLETKNT